MPVTTTQLALVGPWLKRRECVLERSPLARHHSRRVAGATNKPRSAARAGPLGPTSGFPIRGTSGSEVRGETFMINGGRGARKCVKIRGADKLWTLKIQMEDTGHCENSV